MNISDFPIELSELVIDMHYLHIKFINTFYNTSVDSVYTINDLYQPHVTFYDIIVFNLKLVIFYNNIFNTEWSFYYNLRMNSIRYNLLNCYKFAVDNNNTQISTYEKYNIIDFFEILKYDKYIFLKYVHSQYNKLFEIESKYIESYRKKCLKYIYANNCCYCPRYLIDKYNLANCNLDKYKN